MMRMELEHTLRGASVAGCQHCPHTLDWWVALGARLRAGEPLERAMLDQWLEVQLECVRPALVAMVRALSNALEGDSVQWMVSIRDAAESLLRAIPPELESSDLARADTEAFRNMLKQADTHLATISSFGEVSEAFDVLALRVLDWPKSAFARSLAPDLGPLGLPPALDPRCMRPAQRASLRECTQLLHEVQRRASRANRQLERDCENLRKEGWQHVSIHVLDAVRETLELTACSRELGGNVLALGFDEACHVEAYVFNQQRAELLRSAPSARVESGREVCFYAAIGVVLDASGIPVAKRLRWRLCPATYQGLHRSHDNQRLDNLARGRVVDLDPGESFVPLGTVGLSMSDGVSEPVLERTLQLISEIGVHAYRLKLRELATDCHALMSALSEGVHCRLFVWPRRDAARAAGDLVRALELSVCYAGESNGIAGRLRGTAQLSPKEMRWVSEAVQAIAQEALPQPFWTGSTALVPLRNGLGFFIVSGANRARSNEMSLFADAVSQAICLSLEFMEARRADKLRAALENQCDRLRSSLEGDPRDYYEKVARLAVTTLGADVVTVVQGRRLAYAGRIASRIDERCSRRMNTAAETFVIQTAAPGAERRDARVHYRQRERIATTFSVPVPGGGRLIVDFRRPEDLDDARHQQLEQLARLCQASPVAETWERLEQLVSATSSPPPHPGRVLEEFLAMPRSARGRVTRGWELN